MNDPRFKVKLFFKWRSSWVALKKSKGLILKFNYVITRDKIDKEINDLENINDIYYTDKASIYSKYGGR